AHFVERGLDRCSDHARHNFSVVDKVSTRFAEITPVSYGSELAGLLKPASNITRLVLALVIRILFGNVPRLDGSSRFAGRALTRAAINDLVFVAGDVVLHPNGLANNQGLDLLTRKCHRSLFLQIVNGRASLDAPQSIRTRRVPDWRTPCALLK